MFSDFRRSCGGVSPRALGISILFIASLISGCTTTKSVTVGPPAKLAFSVQPGNVAAASAITPAVAVSIEDANGNLVTTATNQVTIAIGTNPANGTLSGTTTVAAIGGVATFSGLSINNVGTGYTLAAAATSLMSATSNAFAVVGPPTKLAFTVQPSNVAAGTSIAPAMKVSVEDANGNVVPTATNQITVAFGTNPSGATLSGTATANASSGAATFANLSINKAGTGYTLTASATGLTGVTSSTFNVTPGAPAKLIFTTQPANTTAGVAISPAVQVTVEDNQGNVVTTATNTITMGIGTGSGTLAGTMSMAAVSGVATFSNLSINLVGTGYTLAASATGLTSATSGAFNILVGAPAKLAFTTQPSNVAAASSIAPAVIVSVEDAAGNVVPTATNSVTVAIGANPSSGVLSGTATAAATAGGASFSNLSINKVGTGYTLTASAAGLTGATSTAFNVTPGAPAKLIFTTQPPNTAAGASISPAVQVTIEDSQSNIVTNATNSVTIAIGTNPSSGTLSGTMTMAASLGVATFSGLSINKVGAGYTLAASATGLTGATSNSFNVTPGSAAKLAFSAQPTNATAGVAISPAVQVTVEDAQGNVVTTATNTITMAIGTGSGTLNGTTSAAAVSGVATFSNLSINLAGTGYTLATSATGLTGATSNAFNVSAAAASKLAFTTQPPSSVVAGAAFGFAVSVEDAFGNAVDPGVAITVTTAIGNNPSGGTLSGTSSTGATGAPGAVATFAGLSINKTGTGYTMSATASGLTPATSSAFTVTSGVAAQLVFTTEPSNANAGAAISPAVQVTVEDSQGNIVTSATNSVTIAIGTNPSGGALTGTATVAAVAGVANFSNLSINLVGTGYTLTANATGLTGGTSTGFNIAAGAASKLAFTTQPPASVAAGASFGLAVTIEDTFGNLVSSAPATTVTVAIGTNPSSGTLSGTASVTTSGGVATFSGLSINKAGSGYTLTASAASLGGATSSAINVGAGSAAILAFTGEPGNTVANSNITPVVAVSVEDAFGNLVTSATNAITIGIGTNPASGTLSGTLTVSAVNGVATFSSLDINNVGSGYTLMASATGLTSATSFTFNIIVSIGPPAKLAFTAQPSSTVAGVSIAPAVQVSVEDSSGNVVPTATNTITMSIGINPVGAALNGTVSVAAVNGVAKFANLSINAAASGYSLQASATSLTGASSTTFNITSAAAAKVVFTTEPPVSVVSEQTFAPAVSIEDAFGNVVTSATNQITVSIQNNPSSGILGGTTAVNAAGGVSAFSNLTIDKAGAGYTLAAASTGLTGSVSSAFSVTAGAAAKLAYQQQPTNIAAGSSITPPVTVAIEDAVGNIVTGAANSVTIAIGTNPSAGTLSGTLTAAATNGVATFSNLSIDLAGTGYTLSATATSLTNAVSNTFTVTPPCTTNCALSGNVSGAWGQGVTITLSGGPSSPSPAVTDANGNYSFTGLTYGAYTVTPSLTGYTYAPSAPSVTVGTNTVQTFVATSAVLSYSVSGTVFYSGSATGVTYLSVTSPNCGGGCALGGITLPVAPSPTGTPFTIRGLPPAVANSLVVRAEIDAMHTGSSDNSNPAGTSGTFGISSNLTGLDITITDQNPPVPATPSIISVSPANGSAVVSFFGQYDNNGDETATQYKIYLGTDSNASNLTPITTTAGNNNGILMISGLTNGANYYFKMSALDASGESAVTSIVGPVLIGATTGLNTVSGSVSFTGTATGPLYVVLYTSATNYFERIPTPTSSPVAFSISGVPSGSYRIAAFLDQNNNGFIDPGDGTNFTTAANFLPPLLTVSGNVTNQALSLGTVSGAGAVTTDTQIYTAHYNGTIYGRDYYALYAYSNPGTKLPVSMTMFSGPNVAVPFDMMDQYQFQTITQYQPVSNDSVSPTVGDTYQFLVTFSDGTTQILSSSVAGVVSSLPQNLAMQTTSPGSATVPLLTWAAPATPPAQLPYEYYVRVQGAEFWNYGFNNNLPSGTTSVLFNVNNRAVPNPTLTPGVTYNWTVGIADAAGDAGYYTTTYSVPNGAGSAAKLAFTGEPSNTTAGTAIPPVQVTVQDASGLTVTSSTASITIGIGNNAGSGALSGTTTVSAVGGVATFSNLSINNPGTGYTLTATSSPLTGATSSAFNVTPACTTNCTLSGNVTVNSSPFPNLTITLTGPSPATTTFTATTNASGNYAFTGLTAGTYAISAPPGYTYIPALPINLAINTDLTQNFTATPALTSYTISGTVTYAGTSNGGRTFIRVLPSGCTGGCQPVAGTSVMLTLNGGVYTGSYTVRGLLPVGSGGNGNGSYVVTAQIDNLNNGEPNASNPQTNPSSPTTVTINSSNVTANLTVADQTPPTPQTPTGLTIILNQQGTQAGGFAMYNNSSDSSGNEIGTSYKLYMGTDSNASNLTPIVIPAHGTHDNVYIFSSITPGTPYYFKISSFVGTTESATSSVIGPVTAAAGTGTNSVATKVTFPGSTTGPLYVGVLDQANNTAYGMKVASPVSGTTYTVTGVPNGTYISYAVIDQNNNGIVDLGDLNNVTGQAGNSPISISGGGTTNLAVALSNANSTAYFATGHQQSGGIGDQYSLNLGLQWGIKRAVLATLISGPNVIVPWDLPVDENSNVQSFLAGTAPLVGDTYTFDVTYNDGTTGVIQYSLPAIPGTSAAVIDVFAGNLTMNSPVAGSPTIPVLNWSAPTPAPTYPYSYTVSLNGGTSSNNVNWYYQGGKHSSGIPSSTLDVTFNTDGSAQNNGVTMSPTTPLPAGGNYGWWVTVQDFNGDYAQSAGASYSTPAAVGSSTQILFIQQPGNAAAGSLMSPIQVAFEDASNNIITSVDSPITLQINNNPGGGSLNGGTTVTSVNGVATFNNLSISSQGNGYTLTASATGTSFTAVSNSFNILAPGTLTINVPFLPAGTVGTTFGTANFSATGGSGSGYTWSISSGALPASLALSNTPGNSTTTIAGIPTTAQSANFVVKVTDSSNNTATTNTLGITINPAISCPMTKLGSESLLTGATYVGLVKGFEDANGPSQGAIAFVSDGNGGITNGEMDFATVLNFSAGNYQAPIAPAKTAILSSGSCYQLGSDHRGTMILNVGGTHNVVYHFSVNGAGTLGRLIEFDDANPVPTGTGNRGAGFFQKQTSASAPSGSFAFGMDGFNNDNCQTGNTCGTIGDLGYQRLAVVGRVTLSGGSGTAGVFDIGQIQGSTNTQINIDTVAMSAFTYAAPDSLGRGTLTIASTDCRVNAGPPCGFTSNFIYYMIDTTHFFMMSADNPYNNFMSGEAIGQSGTFSAASLNGNAGFSMTGSDFSGNSFTVLAVGRLTGNGTGSSVTAWMDKVSNGSTLNTGTNSITGGSFTAGSNGMGSLTLGSGEAFDLVMFGTNSGFLLEGTGTSPGTNIMTGMMQPLTVVSSLSGLFAEGNISPTTTYSKVGAGSINFTSPISGNNDSSQGMGCGGSCLQSNGGISITSAPIDPNGRITLNTAGGSIVGWVMSASHGALLSNNGSVGLTIQIDQ